MSKFQIIVTAIFVIFIVAGVAAFATYKSKDSSSALPSITIWGTFPKDTFDSFVSELNLSRADSLNIDYLEIPENSFRKQFIEELARGKGPDAILIPQQDIIGFYDKIVQIPNNILTQRDFQNTFIPQANLYMTPEGSLALPFVVDPMVMYWNRTIFTNAGLAKYPEFWDEFTEAGKRINVKDENSNIRRSVISMGEFKNINHAREILSALFMQANNPITRYSGDGLESFLDDSSSSGLQSASEAILFFTRFSDPRDPQYSWNRSLPSSKNSFLSGNLATYFGLASEINELRDKNPNLDYDVAPFPQARKGQIRTTYGDMYGLSIVRSTVNQGATYSILQILTSAEASSLLGKLTYLPSVRRDLIASGSVDPYMAIFLDSALISRGWLDTNSFESNSIFTKMIESVTSGRADVYSAIKQASEELDLSLKTK